MNKTSQATRVRRKANTRHQRLERYRAAAKFLWKALSSRYNPLLAQLVVTRRCNLSCSYCNEYDDHSAPVEIDRLRESIEALARLSTAAVTCTGGEPLMHPQLERVIRSIRDHGMIATMITNGFRLNRERIERLNDCGLQEMQISIDNLEPDSVSMKSLRAVDSKLELLSRHARFKVNINSVLGVSDERTKDALEVAARARHYGFYHSVGVLHDESGRLESLNETQIQVYRQIGARSRSVMHKLNHHLFQKNLVFGEANDWKCRAGARYLYVCEDGNVHLCSQRRGYPNKPISEYTGDDVRREFHTRKSCSPGCALSCVHQMSAFDEWRRSQDLPDPQHRDVVPTYCSKNSA